MASWPETGVNEEGTLNRLSIQLLGTVQVALEVPGRSPQPLAFHSQRALELLAYLALNHAAPVPRIQVAGLFWPETAEEQALTNLRKVVHQLRRELPDANQYLDLDVGGMRIRLGAPVRIDAADFNSALQRATLARRAGDLAAEQYALEAALAHCRGLLLPGWYADWVLQERDTCLREQTVALQRLARLLENRRCYRDSIDVLQRLQAVDPLIEETYRQLMRLYVLCGDRAKALSVYQDCREVLTRELGVEPDASLRVAYENLLARSREPIPVSPVSLDGTVRLVGRAAEWNQVQAAWAAAEKPVLLVLKGEAGIGKTRLLEELLEWARALRIDTAQAVCYEAEGELPLAPVAAWLRARPLPGLDPAWRYEIARLAPDAAGAVAVAAPEAAQQSAPLAAPTTGDAGQRLRLFAGLAQALLAGRDGVILTLDNLHWCDRETMEFLHYLLRATQPPVRLLVACTLRPEEPDPTPALARLLDGLRRSGLLVEIALQPLNAEETVELGRRVARGGLSSERSARLFGETEGNPLFIIETVRAGQLAIPPGIQAVIGSRLARLSAAARELAGIAAVIGQSFSLELLGEASGFEELSLLQSYEELLQRRILREREVPGQKTSAIDLDFTHDKIREVTLATLSMGRRKIYHRRVAQALEKHCAGELGRTGPLVNGQLAGQIAGHYEQAGMDQQAAIFRARAARGLHR
jgi:DNA-binding SARP family transcriptional activator